MSDRDDFAELVGSARNVIKSSSFYFTGRIRYGTKGEKVEERLLCMDAIKVYVCSIKLPVKVESQFNILSIKLIERVSECHILIETDEKPTHSLYGLHDKSLEPFLIVLIRNLHAVFPYRLQAIVEIRPENEYDRLFRLSNEYNQDGNILSSECRPCGGFSLRYECACDFFQVQCNRSVQSLVDTVFAHRLSREFTFREFDWLTQKDWLPILAALRHNEWFTKLTIENVKLTNENIEELCNVIRLCKALRELRLINCGLRHDFCTRFVHSLSVSHIEYLDISNNPIDDKGLSLLSPSFQQRKLPLKSVQLQSCSFTHKSLQGFHSTIVSNNILLKNLQILNLAGNRIREENCITVLFQNPENVLEELHLSDLEFSLEAFFHSLSTGNCRLRRLFVSLVKSLVSSNNAGAVKSFFSKNKTLEILQISNGNLSIDFLKELCEGLHSNVHLNEFDLRLPGNQLEPFVHEYATRFASIPSLVALDLTSCDLENEIPLLLSELKKNRKLKSLNLGKNFNNIKAKNMQRTINAMKELIAESDLDTFSIADSKLKENLAEFLTVLTTNVNLKTLDIRGNLMGDTGARQISHILQSNRRLENLFIDRNLLSLNNLEEIVNALEENVTIHYFPVPIIDLIQMKITEKDRMEKAQTILNKLDTICTRNQQHSGKTDNVEALIRMTSANLTKELRCSWEHQQQLIGDRASLDYILSCSNRINTNANSTFNHDELNSLLGRTARIGKISNQLYETFVEEEERFQTEVQQIFSTLKEKFQEKNQRLSKKFYQLFKEQTMINCDDKFQEHIRNFFTHSNENLANLLEKEIPIRLNDNGQQCYVNVVTCLQKRAYDVTNDIASELHKQMESTMLHTSNPQPIPLENSNNSSPTTMDRSSSRNASSTHRLAQKFNSADMETIDDRLKTLKKAESNECLSERSPKSGPSVVRSKDDKESRTVISTPVKTSSPSSPVVWRKSTAFAVAEPESNNTNPPTIYSNVPITMRTKKKDILAADEADLIEHDLLNLVEQEQQKEEEEQKNTPPALPIKKRTLLAATNEHNLDINIESTIKLSHLGKDRPKRPNIRRPAKKIIKNSTMDSSSDGGLLTDDNEEPSTPETPNKTHNEIMNSTVDADPPPPNPEISSNTVSKFLKSALKTPKASSDEPTSSLLKSIGTTGNLPARPSPIQQSINHSISMMSKSMSMASSETSSTQNVDQSPEPLLSGKTSMSTSLYNTNLSSNNGNHDSNNNQTSESMGSTTPSVLTRSGKLPIGTRVLPILETNGETPPVRLRHLQTEKKAPETNHNSESGAETPIKKQNEDHNEQYKRLSVKERARMLTTTIPTVTNPNDKKTNPASTTVTSSTTPRTYRRILDQVNLFC